MSLEKDIFKAEAEQKKLQEKQRQHLLELQKKRLKMKAIVEEKARKEKIKLEKELEKKRLKEETQKARKTLSFSEMREYANSFQRLETFKPREVKETVDLHLENHDTLYKVNPKGYPVEEINWNEPHDIQGYWLRQEPKLWLIVLIIFLFFGSIWFSYSWFIT